MIRLPSIRKSDTAATGVQPPSKRERLAASIEALRDRLREEEAERRRKAEGR